MSKTLLIFLHGSGGSGSEIRSFLEGVPLDEFALRTFRQVCDISGIDLTMPTAKTRPYTPCFGETMNVWFDRSSSFMVKGLDDTEDTAGVAESVRQILDIINVATSSNSYDSIFVGGFSMGGCLILHLLLENLPPIVKGFFSMGSFLVKCSQVLNEGRPLQSGRYIPLLMMHGASDPMIREEWGRATATSLHMRGVDVEYRSFPHLQHEIGEEELSLLLHWIEHIKGKESSTSSSSSSSSSSSFSSSSSSSSTIPPSIHRRMDESGGFVPPPGTESIKLEDATPPQTTTPTPTPTPPSNAAATAITTPPSSLPYILTQSTTDKSKVRVLYPCPADAVDMLISRPILACGGVFEVRSDESGNGVYVEFTSSEPHKTAVEVGKRLLTRLGDGNVNPCPMQ